MPISSGKSSGSLLSTHARKRVHSQFVGIERLKVKDEKTLLYINLKDAEARQLQNDDRVVIFNGRCSIHTYICITKGI